MPRKKKTGFEFVNMKPSLKKIERDIQEIQNSVGGAHAEIINLAQKLIQREGFLDGKTSIINGDSSAPQYTDVSGANRKSKKGANTFHSTKIVERKNSQLKTIFKELNFSKSPIGSKNLYTASNEGIDVRIFKDRRRIKAVYSLKGKYDKIFGVFDGGSKKEKITDSKGKTKNVRRGQRRVIRQGLGKALRRWDKINKFYLEKTIKARNLAKL
jgi:hypothetical protein